VGSISNSSVSSDVIECVLGRKETVSESAAFSNAIMSGRNVCKKFYKWSGRGKAV
jgi:putative SOS response-associated peptidase YedK